MRVFCLVLAAVFLLPYVAGAERLQLDRRNSLTFDLPGPVWSFSRQPPQSLIRRTVARMERQLRAKGQAVHPDAVLEQARQRLTENQGFVCDSASGACLQIEFSPLEPRQALPSDADVATSARYAGQSLAQEPGVVGARPTYRKYRIPGARIAYRLEARYRQDGQARHFIGIVGYFHPYWFFLYYTDPLRNPTDARDMERLLHSVTLHRTIEKK